MKVKCAELQKRVDAAFAEGYKKDYMVEEMGGIAGVVEYTGEDYRYRYIDGTDYGSAEADDF